MSSLELSIIIVNWNSKDCLRACLSSVLAEPPSLAFELIVVDSASFDGCGEMLAREFPGVRFIQCNQNLGFGRSNNLGASIARGEYLLLLNPDTVVRANTIQTLHGVFKSIPDVGILGAKLLNTDGSLQSSCVQPLPTILNQLLDLELLQRAFPGAGLWHSAARLEKCGEPVAVEAVSGACMLLRRALFLQVGGFSKEYFMYAEDLDLCWKAAKAGFRNYYTAACEVVHHGGGSTQQARSRFAEILIPESISRLMAKAYGPAYAYLYRILLAASAILRLAVLSTVLPVAVVRRRTSSWLSPWRKWLAILSWALGLERWARNPVPPT